MELEKGKSLAELAVQYGSDKHGHHYYCEHYERHFAPFRDRPCVFLEMGIGGYQYPDRGGAGLKMWRDWFSEAFVIGIDVYDKSGIVFPKTEKLQIAKCSQNDRKQLEYLFNDIGHPDIIVDDASHNNRRTVESFRHLFPLLKPGGIYAIEDIESSWWQNEEFEGCSDPYNYSAPTTINLIRDLLNDVMRRKVPGYEPMYAVKSISIYDNLVFIEKEAD